MRQFIGPLFVSNALLLGLFCPAARTQIAPFPGESVPPRITQEVDDTRLVTLRGNTHPLARPEFDRGSAPADLPLERMFLVLKPSPAQQSALKQLLAQQQDRFSPNYHKWLTPEEFGRRFGPSLQDIQVITSWLESHGFQVAGVAHGRTAIEFSGTASQVESAFRAAIHKFVVNGEEHWANANDPHIPAAFTPVVAGVATLHNFRKKPQIRISSQSIPAMYDPASGRPAFTATDGTHGLSPADYALIYDINPLYQAGVNGTGTTIAIVSKSNIKLQDVTDFRKLFGLVKNPPQIVLNGKDPGLVKGDETEALLDTSWSGAVAPNATVKLVISADTNASDGVDLSERYIIDNNLADVMSESYGDCEADYTAAGAAQIESLAQQAAAQGITYTVSTGDSGSAGCDDPNSETTAAGPVSVNILASTPYTVAVGGTEFNENGNNAAYWSATNNSVYESVLSYIPEDVWNESCTVAQCGSANAGIWAGGGGASTLFSKPSWQTGITGIPNDGVRDVPDVSLSAASHDYYLLCQDGSCTANSKGQFSFQGVSGTSASAPSFAGMMALVKQKIGSRQGQADYVLYQLAALENVAQCNASSAVFPGGNCVFNDATVGNNAVPGEPGYGTVNAKYQATPGYDLATGLGSVNAANLVNEWSSITSPSGQVSIQPTSLAFGTQAVAGASTSQAITLSNSGASLLSIRLIVMTGVNPSDFTESNNCGTGIPAGGSCTVSVSFVPTATGARSASLTFTDSATNSPQSVSFTGTGTANSQIVFGGEHAGDVRIVGDFDGDGQLDYATWRPSDGIWYVYESSNPGTLLEEQWGLPGDIPVPGDYDGDGKTDFAVWRPSTGTWFILPSKTRTPYSRQWGLSGDVPITGDFDGDGKTDLVVWRPANQDWYFVLSGTGDSFEYQWGLPGDVPVAGDFDRSGKQEMAVWRPSNGNWYIIPADNPESPIVQQWGLAGDIPVPADYDGDGITDFAVWRPSDENWYIIPSSNPGAPYTVQFGSPTNLLATKFNVGSLGRSVYVRVLGDFDGDGQLDFAVWQPSTGNWFVIPSSNPGTPLIQPTWGVLGDVPVPADYDGDGKTDFAVWRPSTGQWWIIPSGNPKAEYVQEWGLPGDIPVPADFDGDGKADLAVWRPSTGYWWITPSNNPQGSYAQQWGLPGDIPVPADFSGTGKPDLAVWRASNGTWYVVPSNGAAVYTQQWGLAGDFPTAGDFGDGRYDYGIWRPSSQSWFIMPRTQPDPVQTPSGLTGNAEIYKQPR